MRNCSPRAEPRRLDQKRLFRDIVDADLLCHLTPKPVIDQRFPGVALVSRLLLWSDMFALECGVRPPFSFAVSRDSLGKELIPICRKLFKIDRSNDHWPEATSTRLVAEINTLIGSPDEHNLAIFVDFFPPVARPVYIYVVS